MTADGPARDTRRDAARVLASAVALRPWLWPVALGETLRLAKPGWWRRWPPVPMPDLALWRFRTETAYGGSGDAVPCAQDVRSFLEWCRTAHDWHTG